MTTLSMNPSRPHPVSAKSESSQPHVVLSIIVPVVERVQDVGEVYRAYSAILGELHVGCEFIFVVDGGDRTAIQLLEQIQAHESGIKIIPLPYYLGESTALAVGFEQANGEIILTVPAYFQTVPEGVTKIFALLQSGEYDLVVSRRHPRIDAWSNRVQTQLFYSLTNWLTGMELHDLGSGLRGMRKQVVKEVPVYGDLHRFFPLLAYQKGFRLIEVEIPQHPADGTQRIYRPGVYLRRILDLLTVVFLFKFTKKPLRFFGLIGTGLFACGFGISSLLAVEKVLGVTALADRPLLVLGVLLMVLGVQVGSIGLLGEIIIFTHARKLKDYTIRKFLR